MNHLALYILRFACPRSAALAHQEAVVNSPGSIQEPLKRRRMSEQGRSGKLRQWWHDWGSLFTGVWLLVVSIIVLFLSIGYFLDQNATEAASKSSCERAREFGPRIANYYEMNRVLPLGSGYGGIDRYRLTIPKTCPS